MKASAKIKPPKSVYVPAARKTANTFGKRIVNVAGKTQENGQHASPFVSLPREPWADEVTE